MKNKNSDNNKLVSVAKGGPKKIDENVLQNIVSQNFPIHPFEKAIQANRLESLSAQYFAMSQAFPNLQAGAQKVLYDHHIEIDGKIPEEVEITTAVGAFLVADEVGVIYALRNGISGLPTILNTRGFHTNMLEDDIERIVGKKIKPDYSVQTKKYLENLFAGLSSTDKITRVATMVAFETHAERMIKGLWNTIANLTNIKKDELDYFRTHVGGDDPAEKYHVQTTTEMIEKLVSFNEIPTFLSEFKRAYNNNVEWCRAISNN
jgi:hypothetical protein